MKKSIPLVILMIMLMMVTVSWSNVLSYGDEVEAEIAMHLKNAEEYESKEIYIEAVAEYQAVLKLRPDDYDLAMRIVGLYDTLGIKNKYVSACENAISADNTQKEPYMLLADYYISCSNYSKAYSVLNKAKSHIPNDNEIESLILDIKKRYTTVTLSYKEVTDFHIFDTSKSKTGYGIAHIDEKMAVVNDGGGISFSADGYEEFGFLEDGLRPVKKNGQYFYIDKDQYKRMVPDEEASYLGAFSNGYAVACFSDGYGYINKSGKIVKRGYKYAGGFARGIAPVQDQSGQWYVINTSFSRVVEDSFDEIKISDLGYCTENGMFFAKKGDTYTLYNNTGEKIAEGFEDVKLFVSNEPAAIKQNGKWGFVNTSGKIVIEPKYDNANSFNVGYAPICDGNKWGAIDIDCNVLIEPEFESMRSFSKGGYSLVKTEDKFKMVVVNLY